MIRIMFFRTKNWPFYSSCFGTPETPETPNIPNFESIGSPGVQTPETPKTLNLRGVGVSGVWTPGLPIPPKFGILGVSGLPGIPKPRFWESRESRSPKSCTLPDVYSTKVNEQLTYVSKKRVSKMSLSLFITKTTATLFLERCSR